MKRAITFMLLLILMLLNITTAWAAGNVAIKFGAVDFKTNRLVFISNGRTLVPLRDIFEAMGASVSWDGKTRTVTARRGTEEIKLVVGSKDARRGIKNIRLDVASTIYNNSTYVPLRFVAESLGSKVAWDAKTKTVTISDAATDTWLEKAGMTGRPFYWKIADVNNDGQPEFMVLAETETGRQFLVFNAEKQMFAGQVANQVNEISLIDLDANTRGISVHQYTPAGLKNITVYKITTEVKELGDFGAGTGNVRFISDGGKTKIVEDSGDNDTTWEYDGSDLVITTPPTGTGSGSSGGSGGAVSPPPAGPTDISVINSVSDSFFDLVLSGDLEQAKALSANPDDPNTAAYIQKSIDDVNNFIDQHNGAAWEPAKGAVIYGDTAEYYSWVKYSDAHGYLVVKLDKTNHQWVIASAEFKVNPRN